MEGRRTDAGSTQGVLWVAVGDQQNCWVLIMRQEQRSTTGGIWTDNTHQRLTVTLEQHRGISVRTENNNQWRRIARFGIKKKIVVSLQRY